jgi:hypothetical protein
MSELAEQLDARLAQLEPREAESLRNAVLALLVSTDRREQHAASRSSGADEPLIRTWDLGLSAALDRDKLGQIVDEL